MENRHLNRAAENAKNNIESVIFDLISEIENYETTLDAMQDNLDDANRKISELEDKILELNG